MQNEIKKAAELIFDMTLNGATKEEMRRAVLYSRTVIDSHRTMVKAIKQSEKENDITFLREKYSSQESWIV